jgi:hypothetical protein
MINRIRGGLNSRFTAEQPRCKEENDPKKVGIRHYLRIQCLEFALAVAKSSLGQRCVSL